MNARSLRRNLVSVVSILALLGLAACGDTGEQAASGLRTINVVSGPNPYLLQAWVADREGYFKEAGLRLKVTETSAGGSATLVAGVLSGDTDFIVQGLAPVAAAVGAGQKVGFACAVANATDRTLMAPATSDLPVLQGSSSEEFASALKGKRIGVVALGSGNQLDTIEVLKSVGLAEDDVTWVAVGGATTAIAALKAGQIDAVASYGGLTEQLIVTGEGKVVVNYPSDVPEFKNFFNSGWMTSEKLYEEDPATVEKFCAAITKASEWMQDDANIDGVDDILAKQMGYDAETVQVFAKEKFPQKFEGCVDQASFENALAAAQSQGLADESLSAKALQIPSAASC